jgi:FAS-associated factor 2
MTLLTRIEGPVSSNQLISALATAVTRNLGALNRRRALKREQEQARELRRMQEEAYHNSLAQDRAKAEQERLAALEVERQEREMREKALIIERKALKREQWRAWKADDLRRKNLIGLKSEIGKTARVGLRLASGERIVQIFPGDIAVTEVYAFVDCYDLLFPTSEAEVTLRTTGESSVSGEFEKPEDYEHEYSFRLVVPMPRKVIENVARRIKDENALWPSGSIVVEEIANGSETEEDSGEDTE